MKIYQVLVVSAGDDAPPGVGLAVDGNLIDIFTVEGALSLSQGFANAAESLEQLIAAGPPYPVSNYRN